MTDDCLFCKIATGEIGATTTDYGDKVTAFEDINPKAPLHFLIIPKKHISTINDLGSEDAHLIGEMVLAAKNIAAEHGHDGYRLVFNCNAEGGQEVYHIHLHLLAGRQMVWPPG